MADNAQVAVYIDFDNVVISRYDQLHGHGSFRDDRASGRNPTQVARHRLTEAKLDFAAIMDYAATIGPVAISRAYANWSNPVNASYDRDMIRSSIDLVQLFPVSGTKNGADIRLAIDVIDDLSRYPYISHVVIVAGDSDYISLAQRCKRLGRRIIGIGVEKSVSTFWEAACDEFRFYESVATVVSAVLDDGDTAEHDVPDHLGSATEADPLLVRAARLLHAKDPDAEWIAAAGLKSLMKRLEPAFDEHTQGFTNFTSYLRAHSTVVAARSTNSGTLVHLLERGHVDLAVPPDSTVVPLDEDGRIRKQRLGFRRPVTTEVEDAAVRAVRRAWEVCDPASVEGHTVLPSAPVRAHLLGEGVEPEVAKTATHVALACYPVLLREDDMRLVPNPELLALPDAAVIDCLRGGLADRLRADPDDAVDVERLAEIIHGADAADPVRRSYRSLSARLTLRQMTERIGGILLPPQVLWDVADSFAKLGEHVPLSSPDSLRREIHGHLHALDRDPDTVDFPAAHQALLTAGLILPTDSGSYSTSVASDVAAVSAAMIAEWSRRCRLDGSTWNWEPFYQLVLPDRFHLGWRAWVRGVITT